MVGDFVVSGLRITAVLIALNLDHLNFHFAHYVIVAMAMPASTYHALQRRAAQSVDTTFRISQ